MSNTVLGFRSTVVDRLTEPDFKDLIVEQMWEKNYNKSIKALIA